ncbi:peptidase S9 [Arenimonas soli]|uniref:Peptidase S9 n=1 Tax=Arenimonas soli TaxID=2269504 RepID=A0ABQ1HT71_9GAMM|nr:S9 family peptidase [Arenimonas soli]GGA87709.1 peptidase S9 [Arenimonas soli]
MRFVLVVLFALILPCPPALAAPAVPAPLPIRDFFQSPEFSDMALSPDGKHLLATVRRDEQWSLVVLRVADLAPVVNLQLGEDDYVSSLRWKDENQFLFSVDKLTGSLLDDLRFVFLTRWYVGQADGSDPTPLIGGFGGIVDLLPDDPERILVSYYSGDSTYVMRIPLRGQWPRNPMKVLTPLRVVQGIVYDSKNNPRYIWGERIHGKSGAYVRRKDRWAPLKIWDEGEPERIPLAIDEERNLVFLAASDQGEPHRIDAVHMDSGETTPVLPSRTVEPEGLLMGDAGPVAAAYQDGRLDYRFVDKDSTVAKVYAGLVAAFPGQALSFEGRSKDDRLYLVRVYGDRNPGEYFLFDTQTGRARFLLAQRSWIKPDTMAAMQPVSFKARDGLELHGYLTLPPGREAKGLPLVLMPHGGPHGVRDRWGFDPEAQLLASRGYAVLQLNFRGSDGYGSRFRTAGYGQWGDAMVRDLLDGLGWAVAQGIADPRRVCAYGASYGAFSALQAAALAPDALQCTAGYVGVYSIPLMFKSGDTSESDLGRKFMARVMPEGPEAQRMQSPAYNAARIKVPVLLAHGKMDVRAPIDQFEFMRDQLAEAGNPPEVTIVEEKEGHGFVDLDRKVAYYEKLLAFLDKHTAGNR